ncbi:hypothetical protein OEZ86_006930 [Tetradesmus obliquus]|nr:hypothetical protein OEZ86_006930 [Tetradesmus obliquus]
MNGTWSVSGGCELPAVVLCEGQPPLQASAAEAGWNSSCSNATVGTNCTLDCASDAVGDGYTAECTASGNWSVSGACALPAVVLCEGQPPLQASAAEAGWNSSCSNATVGTNCTLDCTSGAVGDGYTAECTASGNWSVSGACALPAVVLCEGQPPLQASAAEARWNSSCSNATVGTNCTLDCASGAIGDGYTAECTASGNWSVSGACALPAVVLCEGQPPLQASAAEAGWNSSCSNATVGTNCTLDCASDAVGDGYTAECTASGNWSVSGACALPAVVLCEGQPPLQASAAEARWNSSCSNATVGTNCTLDCASGAIGDGYTAECTASGNWSVSGACALPAVVLCEGQPPLQASAAEAGWNSSCSNATVGTNCTLDCASDAVGDGYTAECTASGNWSVSGACALPAVVLCEGQPPLQASAAEAGWNSSCSNATVGTNCTLDCASGAVGDGYKAECTASGNWSVSGACALPAVVLCEGQPPLQASAAEAGWNSSCSNATVGTNCTLDCTSDAVGDGYTAECTASGNWSVSGACALPAVVLCEGQPPLQASAAQAGWNSSCSNATVGTNCTLDCASDAVGDGYTAECTASGNWSVSGACALPAVVLCEGQPPLQASAAEAGWNSSCSNATVGTNCTLDCTSGAVGDGYTAECTASGNWSVSGACSLPAVVLCEGQPPLQASAAEAGWNSSCSNATVGTNCTLDCASDAVGDGYTAECTASGNWSVSGACALPAVVLCEGQPPLQASAAEAGWNSSCSNATVGTNCTLDCASGAVGDGYTAECTASGNWSVSGACALPAVVLCEGQPPLQASAAEAGWNSSCSNATVGTNCTLDCTSGAVGDGYTAECTASGNWSVSGACSLPAVVLCEGQPPLQASAAEAGWNSSCSNATVGTNCTLDCTSDAVGDGYTAECTASGNWSVSGACALPAVVLCEGQPPLQASAAEAGWNSSCSNATVGTNCTLDCTSGAVGDGYTAECTASGNWSVSGACALPAVVLCEGQPPLQASAAEAGWNSSCSNATVGTNCTLDCTSGAVGDGYTAECTASGNWSVSGACALPAVVLCEGQPPLQASAAEAGWNSSCSNATVGTNCTLDCTSDAVGDGYTAECTASGNWSVSGACSLPAVVLCEGQPPLQASAAQAGWNSSCSNATVGTNCTLDCASDVVGDGYTAECTASGNWSVSGACALPAVVLCEGQPPLQASAAQAGWNSSCSNATVGTNCTLDCASDAVGDGYTAECTASGNWSVSGACALPAVVLCEGQPPLQASAAEAGWNSSCSNATVGTNCTLDCTSGAVGDGYTAECTASGNWSVSGACALPAVVLCEGQPPLQASAAQAGWNSSCSNATVGTNCTLDCASDAVGDGYKAECTASGNWSVSGACALPAVVLCEGQPPLQASAAEAGWNSSCSNATVGTNCTLDCASDAVGDGYTAECTASGNWSVSGACALPAVVLCEGQPPLQASAAEAGWNSSCSNATVGTNCTLDCTSGAVGDGYTAECTASGNWSVSGACALPAVVLCEGQPPLQASAAEAGWNSSCSNATVGTNCTLDCASDAIGDGYTAECTASGNWSVSGACALPAVVLCEGQPPLQASAAEAGWNSSCSNATVGTNCTLNCTSDAVGDGYTAECTASGNWSVSGACALPAVVLCEGQPPLQASAAEAGWNSSCSNATVGTNCTLDCASDAVGDGYTAECTASGNWSVSGACALPAVVLCEGQPPLQASAAEAGWNSSCSNATVGTNCTLDCASDAVGDGYTAECTASGNWSVSGACALPAVVLCEGQPPLQASAAEAGWNSSCSNATVGTNCTLDCASGAVGDGYKAECTASGNWSVSGACSLPAVVLCEGQPPLQASAAEAGWNSSCSNATVGTNCTLDCTSGAVGDGYTAECTASGNWSVSGTCAVPAVVLCEGQPPLQASAAEAGWNSSCSNATVGTNCTMDCASDAVGDGYTAECTASGNWSVSGACSLPAVVLCEGQPPLQASAAEAGWNSSCSNATVGTNCTLDCTSGAVGDGYTAECTASGNWSVSGTCAVPAVVLASCAATGVLDADGKATPWSCPQGSLLRQDAASILVLSNATCCEVDCSSIANITPNRTTNSCECIQPDHSIAAFDGTQLLQCLPSNTTSCPGSATLPVKTADGFSLIQCLVASSANTPCPSGYLTMYGGSPSVAAECRPEPASSQQTDYVCAASYAPFRVALQDGSKLAGCIDTGSSIGECPASAVKLTNGSSLTVCMRGLATCPGNYPYTTSLGSGALYGCSSVDIPMSITCWAGYVPVINADGSTVDCIMDGQACPQSHPAAARRVSSGTAQVAKCMPQLQTCPANFNFPFYSFDSASSTLSISSCWETDMKSSCGNSGSNPGDQYDIAITDRSSGVTIGCVQNGATSCPASFPEASFNSGKLAGCKAARNCYSEDVVEMVDGAGKVVDCWPLSDKKPCPEGYISLWSGYNTLARCLASSNAQGAAAACPSGYQFPLYGESSAGSFTLRACWIDGGIHDCSSVAKSSPIIGDYGVVGCGFGICPNDFIVTVYGSLDDAVNDPKGCLSTRSQCSQGLGGHNFNLFGALGDLELCIQSPESSGSTSCSDVPGYEGLQLVDSSGGWVGCTADTICPEQFPQRTQDGASCQEASASGRRRLRR